jgi:aryl-alcohol dehydrogenase-like predicted oxidoreductase
LQLSGRAIEQWTREWLQSRKVRDQMIITTKFSTNFKVHLGAEGRINTNYGGNSTKTVDVAVDSSLQKLQTSNFDILYVHWYDHVTPVSS